MEHPARPFTTSRPRPAFEEALAEAARLGRELKVPVRHSPLKAEELPVCEAEPHQSLFVGVDGSIAPCMYLCLPKKGRIPRIFLNQSYKAEPRIFGNIATEELAAIWQKEKYRSFRRRFEERIKAAKNAADLYEALSSPQRPAGGRRAPAPFQILPDLLQSVRNLIWRTLMAVK